MAVSIDLSNSTRLHEQGENMSHRELKPELYSIGISFIQGSLLSVFFVIGLGSLFDFAIIADFNPWVVLWTALTAISGTWFYAHPLYQIGCIWE